MADYQPISCDLYDWLEIAARWQLPVTLASHDGRRWDDRVLTIEASDGVEYLLLESGERHSLAVGRERLRSTERAARAITAAGH